MSDKLFLFTLILVVVLIMGCAQPKPTPLFRPTNTPQPPTPSAAPTATFRSTATTASPTDIPTTPATDRPVPTPTERTGTEATATPPSPEDPTQPPAPAFPPAITLEPALTGFQTPVYLTYASETPPWASRLFVVEKAGRIMLVTDGLTRPAPFLDITDRVGSSGSEQGLLSVAFPPDWDEVFYVNYTDRNGDTVVARYRLAGGEPLRGDPDSEQKILEIAQPAGNHNGGQLQFGPDGYLYVGMGDGGRAGDPWENAQNPDALLGKLLRVDVAGVDTYTVPEDNPFVDRSEVRPEIWALGLRNPWRFSFDPQTQDLYIADVGQNVYEEVNVQPASSGGGENYGWDFMEGNHCFEPSQNCATEGLTRPVAEYDHSQGCSVTGGYVYRGARYPQMVGVYFFGDFCSGNVWGLRRADSGEWEMALLLETDASISSFGQDATGELYLLDYRKGTIYHLAAAP